MQFKKLKMHSAEREMILSQTNIISRKCNTILAGHSNKYQ